MNAFTTKPPNHAQRTRPVRSTFVMRAAVVFGFVCSGWLTWFAAQSLVVHFEVDFRLRDAGFGFISSAALIISVVGVYPVLVCGAVLGIIVAAWFIRHRVSTEAG